MFKLLRKFVGAGDDTAQSDISKEIIRTYNEPVDPRKKYKPVLRGPITVHKGRYTSVPDRNFEQDRAEYRGIHDTRDGSAGRRRIIRDAEMASMIDRVVEPTKYELREYKPRATPQLNSGVRAPLTAIHEERANGDVERSHINRGDNRNGDFPAQTRSDRRRVDPHLYDEHRNVRGNNRRLFHASKSTHYNTVPANKKIF